jgi:putative FmdB family regulatory protein
MPTYAYRCPKCGHEFQKFQKMSDKTRPRCPKCKAKAERVITGGAGLVFKGSGFYITDYKRAGEKQGAEGTEKKDTGAKKAAGEPKSGGESPKPKADKKKSGDDH